MDAVSGGELEMHVVHLAVLPPRRRKSRRTWRTRKGVLARCRVSRRSRAAGNMHVPVGLCTYLARSYAKPQPRSVRTRLLLVLVCGGGRSIRSRGVLRVASSRGNWGMMMSLSLPGSLERRIRGFDVALNAPSVPLPSGDISMADRLRPDLPLIPSSLTGRYGPAEGFETLWGKC